MNFKRCALCGWESAVFELRPCISACPGCGNSKLDDLVTFKLVKMERPRPKYRVEAITVIHKPHGMDLVFMKIDEDTCQAVFGQYHKFNHQLDFAFQIQRDRIDEALKALGFENLPRSDVGN